MTEIFFYHLLNQMLEAALPALLEKSLQRGWRVVVQCASATRLKALDDALWSYSAESFLPHATSSEDSNDTQPIVLTTDESNPNRADVRIFVESCLLLPVLERQASTPYKRALLIFDGRDPDDVAQARGQWKALKSQNYPVTYWQQDANGQWGKKQ